MSAEWMLHWEVMSPLGMPCRHGWLHASAHLCADQLLAGCLVNKHHFLHLQVACLMILVLTSLDSCRSERLSECPRITHSSP